MSHFLHKALGVALFFALLSGCTRSSSTPTKITFSSSELSNALRSATLRFAETLPSEEHKSSIESAADPRAAYEAICDQVISGSGLEASLMNMFRTTFGMGGDDSPAAEDDPALLATYVVMNDLPYGELLTAKYKVNANGTTTNGQGSNALVASLAGFLTLPSWLDFYVGNDFLFNYVREVANVTECYLYPDPDSVGAWDVDTIACKYPLIRDGTPCHSCHKTMNVRRIVWKDYQRDVNGNSDYQLSTNPTNVYQHESDFDCGSGLQPVTEPRTPGATYTFLRQIQTPADLGEQITETDRFKECTARRFLAFALGYPTGSAGMNGIPPYDFKGSSKAGDGDLLTSWSDKLVNQYQMRVRSFLKDFCKSDDFILRSNFF